MDTDRRALICAILLAALVLLLYIPGLGAPFLFDDTFHITGNPFVRFAPYKWAQYFFDRRASTTIESFQFQIYRPLAVMLSSAVFHVFGMKAFWFHAVNLLLHIANAWLLFFLLAEIAGRFPALAAGLLFGLHPVNMESVVPAVGLSSTLSLFFVLLAAYAYITRRRAWITAALSFCAMFSKETAVILPAGLLLLDLTVLKRRPDKKVLTAVFLCAAIYLVLRGLVTGNAAHQRLWGFGYLSNLDMVFRTLFFSNIPSLVFPVNTHPLFCGLPLAKYPALELCGFLAAAGAAVFVWCKYWTAIPPLANLGLLWLLLSLLPTSNIIPLRTVGADRFLYFASAGLAVAAAAFLRPVLWHFAAVLPVCLFFAWQSLAWQLEYRSEVSFLSEIARRHPDDYICNLYASTCMPSRARSLLVHGLKTAPVNYRTLLYAQLGGIDFLSGKYESAVENYTKAAEADPANWRSLKGIALSYCALGDNAACGSFLYRAGYAAFTDKSSVVRMKSDTKTKEYGGVEIVDHQGSSELPLPREMLEKLLPVLLARYE
ncbi:MAG: hypothetical protein PHP45_09025 [Elusimicrobiales bacterium]|nr:hypothetical protein [Elusimicrobiales bacterium]